MAEDTQQPEGNVGPVTASQLATFARYLPYVCIIVLSWCVYKEATRIDDLQTERIKNLREAAFFWRDAFLRTNEAREKPQTNESSTDSYRHYDSSSNPGQRP